MTSLLWPIVLIPFAGSLILAVFGAIMPKKTAGALGCASVGISWILTMLTLSHFLASGPSASIDSLLYSWMSIGSLNITMGLHLDALSMVMISVITFVAFLIHLYASQSMFDEDGYSRFFAYLNLFVGSMLTLVLANNLFLLYLGWEGVGLCSYLLIGFWYKDANNGHAAQKAFIVTRIGDTALAIGLFMLFFTFGTFNMAAINASAPALLAGKAIATTIAILIIGGAIGKSAQVPLQTWLPDAMAGPTPVSALIHAATMVTAGVYLIARLHTIFMLSPTAMMIVAIIGTVTLVYSGFSALVQRDIKRVLAYSTISQIGYMFLALGVGAWTSAMFHFMTHAFFKALLFLSAGVVIDALHHEHDIMKMGGLRRKLPIAFWTYLIGSASLSALPLVTAGFYSKDAIIWAAYSSPLGNTWLWLGALVGAFITSIYSFRVFFLVFYGDQKMEITKQPGMLMSLVLIVLAFFSITAGFVGFPEVLLHYNPFGKLLSSVFEMSAATETSNHVAEGALLGVATVETLLGIFIAYAYARSNRWAWVVERSKPAQAIHRFFLSGWGFDWLYEAIFVKPFKWLANVNRNDFTDSFYTGLAEIAKMGNRALSYSQAGKVRNYATGVVIGAVILAACVLLILR